MPDTHINITLPPMPKPTDYGVTLGTTDPGLAIYRQALTVWQVMAKEFADAVKYRQG